MILTAPYDHQALFHGSTNLRLRMPPPLAACATSSTTIQAIWSGAMQLENSFTISEAERMVRELVNRRGIGTPAFLNTND
jgi:hypothetical protein